jgi:hypothetical protein
MMDINKVWDLLSKQVVYVDGTNFDEPAFMSAVRDHQLQYPPMLGRPFRLDRLMVVGGSGECRIFKRVSALPSGHKYVDI